MKYRDGSRGSHQAIPSTTKKSQFQILCSRFRQRKRMKCTISGSQRSKPLVCRSNASVQAAARSGRCVVERSHPWGSRLPERHQVNEPPPGWSSGGTIVASSFLVMPGATSVRPLRSWRSALQLSPILHPWLGSRLAGLDSELLAAPRTAATESGGSRGVRKLLMGP